MKPKITCKNLCKSFQNGDDITEILKDISVDIFPNALTLLVGPSGCGKTTLISTLTGILSSTSGDILLRGNLLNRMSDLEKVLFRRTHIGFIFQQFNLLPALTGVENASIPLIAAGVPSSIAHKKAEDILHSIGLEGHAHKYPRQLSGGQQQRVAIARALVHDPDIIVCDEPTASLDAHSGKSVMEILKTISQDPKRTVLVVTHDTRIFHFADRILQMEDGKIMADCDYATFKTMEQL